MNTLPTHTLRVEWGAIFAGTVFAIAISVVLLQFGSAVGLSATSPLRGEGSLAAWGVIASGVWLLWVQLLASLGGGYIAGRLRTPMPGAPLHDVEIHDGIAGLTTWAFSTVLVFTGASALAAFSTYIAAVAPGTEDVVAGSYGNSEKNTAIIFAFAAGSTALLSGAASWFAGAIGGKHRDESTDFGDCFTFRK